MKDFFMTFLYDKNDAHMSKTKLGIWLSCAATILMARHIITIETFYMLGAITTAIIGVGIRDLRKGS